MKKDVQVILPITCLVLTTLSCQAVMGGGETNTPPPNETLMPLPTETSVPFSIETPTSFPTEIPPSTGEVLLSDDFTSNHWGTGTDAEFSIDYVNGALQFVLDSKNLFIWSKPNDETNRNVHIEVTAINNDTDSTTAFGLLCNMQPDGYSFYSFAITPAGEYAITKATSGEQ